MTISRYAHRRLAPQWRSNLRRGAGHSTRLDGASAINVGSALTGVVAAKTGTLHAWLYRSSEGPAARQVLLSNTGGRFEVAIESTGVLSITGDRPSDGVNVLDIRSATALTVDKWHHVMASWDLNTPAKLHLYVDGASDLNSLVSTDNLVDYARADWSLGSDTTGAANFTGSISELWLHSEYIDLSLAARQRQFLGAAGLQVLLGHNGQRPTGTQPILMLRGGPSTIRWNRAGREWFNSSIEGEPLLHETPPIRIGL